MVILELHMYAKLLGLKAKIKIGADKKVSSLLRDRYRSVGSTSRGKQPRRKAELHEGIVSKKIINQ